MKSIIIFAIVQVINVCVSTLKYVLTVKASPFIAGIVNAASYTISAVATKCITGMELSLIIPITFMCNLIGVPLGRFILDRTEKDKLWVYNATVRTTENAVRELRTTLKNTYNIHSIFDEIVFDQLYSLRIFAYSKHESSVIKNKLNDLNAKYFIVEPK